MIEQSSVFLQAARCLAACAFVVLSACAGSDDDPAPAPTVTVLSSDPSRVTGTDALVQVNTTGDGVPLMVTLNGADISVAFSATGKFRLGRVTGLKQGNNTLTVQESGGVAVNTLLVAHPLAGPLVSGTHQTPFICETNTFLLPDGSTLGPAADADCNAPKKVLYVYKTTTGAFKTYDSTAARPSDMAQATIGGATVDLTVRLETGVINRSIYQIAFVHKPGTSLPAPDVPLITWNGNLVYAFGGGCGVAYRQGRSTGSVINNFDGAADALGLGFAVASSSLNVLGNNCNDVVSAETAAMVKEYFIEQFGKPGHTIGAGGSGGSMQQHLIAQNYPGILDGLLPGRSFADTITVLQYAADCPLLNNFFATIGASWTPEQKTAVSGFYQYQECSTAWLNYLPRWVSPLKGGCDPVIPQPLLYDPITNPAGTRCGYFDNLVNVFGKDASGATRRTLDNEGLQYGLQALNAGAITVDQFLDLNDKIGGFDADSNIVPSRMAADPEALRIAYQSGRVNEGVGLDAIPIIDTRSYTDLNVPADVHTFHTTFKMRARLLTTNGNVDNEVMWVTATKGGLLVDLTDPTSPLRQVHRQALVAMDQWLTAIDHDASMDSQRLKVSRNKPASLKEGCFDAAMNKIDETLSYTGTGTCMKLYQPHGDPRTAAGEPIAGDILKCALKPVDRASYGQALTDAQWARLQSVFAKGVCDYSKLGIEQQRATSAWKSFN